MAKPLASGQIRVGPAGWSYPDWEGVVYPARPPRGFHQAEYLARFFDTVEINSSFYRPLRPDTARLWLRKVAHNQKFKFTAKLLKLFTHERNASRQDELVVKQGLAPLVEAGRLGALLLQFPWSFRNNRENHEYLSGLIVRFVEYPLVVEVRHDSWNRPEVFAWLQEVGVGFCNIDQPVIGASVAPSEQVTARIGYVRLHGRNYQQWFGTDANSEQRYNYLYSPEELVPWAERIRSIALRAEVTYVITNNHFRGKAIANALQLVHLITKSRVRAPETLVAQYPQLESIALPEPAPALPLQSDLMFEKK